MPINIVWHVPERIVHITVTGIVSLEDSGAISSKLTSYVGGTATGKIHLVFDLTKFDDSQANSHLLASIITPLFLQSPLGYVIGYTPDPTLRKQMGMSITTMFRTRMRMFETGADALKYLQDKDESLGSIPPLDESAASVL